jgi:hypothetical protein
MYNNADRIARWAANDYIQMDDDQEAYFTAEVKAIHYWHRTRELPLYADYLQSLPASIDNGVAEDEVQDLFDTLYSWWEVLEARAMPMMTEMLLSLSDEQLDRLPGRLDDDNEEFEEGEDERPLDEVQEEWMQGYVDVMSRFTGRLSKEQKSYLEAQSVRYVPQFGLWADYRQRWQADLMTLLREGRDDPELFAGQLVVLMNSRESYYGEELTGVFETNEQLAKEVTAWLLNNLTDKQRERFYTRIGEMAETFRELAADVPDEIPPGGGCLVLCDRGQVSAAR